jgi:hypothetical protein
MSEQREAATSNRGFDPARQAELGELGRRALALTQGENRASINLEELIATGYSLVALVSLDQPVVSANRRTM